jgi:hypothetical protein
MGGIREDYVVGFAGVPGELRICQEQVTDRSDRPDDVTHRA